MGAVWDNNLPADPCEPVTVCVTHRELTPCPYAESGRCMWSTGKYQVELVLKVLAAGR
jgi:hypothetical protein